MKKVSFEEIGELTVTFYAQTGVNAGQVVKLAGDSMVGTCAAGDRICGLATCSDGECAAVQVKGFAEIPYTGAVTVGWNKLAADGEGGMTVNESGSDYLVVSVDSASDTAVICL